MLPAHRFESGHPSQQKHCGEFPGTGVYTGSVFITANLQLIANWTGR